MKTMFIVVAAVFVGCCLRPAVGLAQSKAEIKRLTAEAFHLKNKGTTEQDKEKAIEKFRKLEDIWKRASNQTGEALACMMLGDLYKDLAQFDKALESYQRSVAMLRRLKDAKFTAIALNSLSLLYKRLGKTDDAIRSCQESLTLRRQLGDKKGECKVLSNLGDICEDAGQYAKAVDYYEKSIAIKRKLGDLKGEGQSLNNLGNVYLHWCQYARAAEYYEMSLAIKRKLGDLKGEAASLNNLGIVYSDWGQYAEAVDYHEKSLAICRKLGDLKGEAQSLNSLGVVYWKWSHYGKAVDYHEKSLAIKRKLGDLKGEATSLNNLGIVYSDWGQNTKAVEYYEKDLAICRKFGDLKGEAQSLNNLGVVYKKWGQYSKAVECFEKDLAICRKFGNLEGKSSSLNNLGILYSDWGQYPKAVEYYEESLAICRKLGDQKGECMTLGNLGSIYKAWGQYQRAVELYEKSAELARKLGDQKTESNALNNLGDVYAAQGDYQKALVNFRQGLAIKEKVGVPTSWSKGLIAGACLDLGDLAAAENFAKEANRDATWGRFWLYKGDDAKAKNYYQKILTAAEKSRNVDTLFTGNTGLGMACEGLGEQAKAAGYFHKAVELTESLRSSLNEAERETFFDVKVNGFYRTAPYEGLARVLTKMNKPLEALKQSEYLKARLFAEAVSKRGGYTGTDVPKEIRDKDNSLNNELGALSKNLQKAYEKGNKEVIASLEPQVKQAKENFAAHVKMLRDKYPLFAATKYPQPMDLSQTALSDNECVLSYDVGDPGFIVYLTKGKELKKALYKPVPRKELDSLVRKFIEPLEIKGNEDIEAKIKRFDFGTGKKLADMLLTDILPELPKDTPLIVVPADCLGVLPFEMLTLNDDGKIVDKNGIPNTTGADFFGDRNPISYYQSITALTLARNFAKQKGTGNKLLVICDPVFSAEDPRAKESAAAQRQELLNRATKDLMACAQTQNGLVWKRMALTKKLGEDLQKAYPNVTDVFEGLKATKATFMKKDLTKYQAIVFGTHGYAGMDLGGLREPVLVLTLVNQPEGEDGFLRQSEVMGLKMNADVVALTACQSGLGRRISGEGTMGMGRAFQYAGAKSVLMTLWSVAQKSSVDMTDSFFRHLKEGKPKLEALRLARDEIRKNGYDHPFFWAPFILVGEVQ